MCLTCVFGAKMCSCVTFLLPRKVLRNLVFLFLLYEVWFVRHHWGPNRICAVFFINTKFKENPFFAQFSRQSMNNNGHIILN